MRKKKILVVDDEKLVRWSLSQKLSEWGHEVLQSETARSALQAVEEKAPDLVLLDIKLPDQKGTDLLAEIKEVWPDIAVIMVTASGAIDDAVTSMKRGAYDFITKPVDFTKLESTIKNALETVSLRREVAYFKEKENRAFGPYQIVAASTAMKDVLGMVRKIAESETSIILLQGESGTGKDLLSQAIHHLSRRNNAPYMAINCSTIPENLMESELFGHEKGAFTDAKAQKKGLAEMVDEGTLFLDEISTLSLNLQAKLLRFLETHTFKRVGGLKDIEVDIRVIVATNNDLEELSGEGQFRKDLFYRLNVCPVSIPPLRKRREDIIPLANHFINHYNAKFRKEIKGLLKETETAFLKYDWPGNVRELKNAVERAMIFEESPFITVKHLPIHLNGKSGNSKKSLAHSPNGPLSLPDMEKKLIRDALREAGGNKTRAARLLKISRDTLRYRMKKFNLELNEEGSLGKLPARRS